MGSEEVARNVDRIANAVIEHTRDAHDIRFVGIRRGGVVFAERIIDAIRLHHGIEVPLGTVDIALYRDDAATTLPSPKIGPSHVPFPIDGKDVVLVDDVLHTGRTVRAAIECLLDYGRPRRVWLAVLCDRGERELPIAPDFVGRVLEVPQGFSIEARFDQPSKDSVIVMPKVHP